MKISELFSKQTAYADYTKKTGEAGKAQGAEADAKLRSGAAGEDEVSISPRARQFQQISGILAADESERSARVAEIKKGVENGTYKVDSQDVAQAVDSFLFSRG